MRLPAQAWGEKDGTVTNSERRISRQRSFLPAPGEAKPDWWIIAEVAKRMGWHEAFDYPDCASIFREFAAQTGFENAGQRILDISNLAAIDKAGYDTLLPFQWGEGSPFANRAFSTPDGKARLVPVRHSPRSGGPGALPLRLNTGRYRDQWHTMTRTGLSPKLSQHRREPLVEAHPDTIGRYGLEDGGLARVETAAGASIFRVASSESQRRQELFVPIHWTDQNSSSGRTGLLPTADRDPVSGQPGFKNTPARITPYRADWSGFLLTHDCPGAPDCAYWTHVRTARGWLTELAGLGDPAALMALLPKGERVEMIDGRRGNIRSAVLVDGRLQAVLFVARAGGLPQREWLIGQLGAAGASSVELLAGRSAVPSFDRGPIVCACFDIGMATIVDAIASQALTSVEAVGKAINAGTNCGSCRPAISRLFAQEKGTIHA